MRSISVTGKSVLLNREDSRWMKDNQSDTCLICKRAFSTIRRRKHHCRMCGILICVECSKTINTAMMSIIENDRYVVISHRWNEGFHAEEMTTGQTPDEFWEQQSKAYCSVMFASHDRGKTWSIYKKSGVGAIGKIKKAQAQYLPKEDQGQDVRICIHCHSHSKIGSNQLFVLSVDNINAKDGVYFNFDISVVDNILGHSAWSGETYQVQRENTGEKVQVKLWRQTNGGSDGDGHGRCYQGKPCVTLWAVGDVITFLDYGNKQQKELDNPAEFKDNGKVHAKQDDEKHSGEKQDVPRSNIKKQTQITIDIKHTKEDAWGSRIDFNLKVWKVIIFPGKQFDRLGIQTGDMIIARNNEVINHDNREDIREKLLQGEACTITFLQNEAKPKEEKTETIEITFQTGELGMEFDGNRIIKVVTDGQASNAGICVGWTIMTVNGETQKDDSDEISQAIMKTHDLGKSTVFLFRKERLKSVTFEPGLFGITFVGNVVTKVSSVGQGYQMGVCPGWIIIMVNGVAQPNIEKTIKESIIKTSKKGKPTVILFQEAPYSSELDQYIDNLSDVEKTLKKEIENLEKEGKDTRDIKKRRQSVKHQVTLATKRKVTEGKEKNT